MGLYSYLEKKFYNTDVNTHAVYILILLLSINTLALIFQPIGCYYAKSDSILADTLYTGADEISYIVALVAIMYGTPLSDILGAVISIVLYLVSLLYVLYDSLSRLFGFDIFTHLFLGSTQQYITTPTNANWMIATSLFALVTGLAAACVMFYGMKEAERYLNRKNGEVASKILQVNSSNDDQNPMDDGNLREVKSRLISKFDNQNMDNTVEVESHYGEIKTPLGTPTSTLKNTETERRINIEMPLVAQENSRSVSATMLHVYVALIGDLGIVTASVLCKIDDEKFGSADIYIAIGYSCLGIFIALSIFSQFY